jgi:hypothetical protein
MAELIWEDVKSSGTGGEFLRFIRAEVPSGWLVETLSSTRSGLPGTGLTFVPDPDHKWK